MVIDRLWALAWKVILFGLIGAVPLTFTACKSGKPAQPASEAQPSTAPASGAQTSAAKPAVMAGSPEKGQQLFSETCSTCHGDKGQGLPNLGGDLQTSKFVAHSTDAQVVALIEAGVPTTNPLNKTNMSMPPKGGNPALTEQDLYDIVSYIRQLQKTKGR